MPHVVTAPCALRKSQACVDVCPVDAFHEGENMLFIHPDECTDCGLCVAACPNQAIYAEPFVPAEWREFIELNLEMAGQAPRVVRGR